MTTEAQFRANRANAKLSTGAKTRAGKAKVAGNALRHGLSLSVIDLPEFEQPIARLAKLLAGSDDALLGPAHAIAASMIDVKRIERVKLELIQQVQDGASERVLADLRALERYEQRALSKRKFAMRRFHSSEPQR